MDYRSSSGCSQVMEGARQRVVCAAVLHECASGRLPLPLGAPRVCRVVSGCTWEQGRAGCGHRAPAPRVLTYQEPQQKGGNHPNKLQREKQLIPSF